MNTLEIYKTMEYGSTVENPGAAMAWLEAKKRQLELFIDNQWKVPHEKEYFDHLNPITGKFLTKSAKARQSDINFAVTVAKKAQPLWWGLSGYSRARFLSALGRQIQKQSHLLSLLETLSSGRITRTVKSVDLPLITRLIYHYAGWTQLIETKLCDYTPLGVVGQINTGHLSLLSLVSKIVPALAMGNSVVLKPAISSSVTAVLFAEICQKINLPPGVINIVTGDEETKKYLSENSVLDQISFTGSIKSARTLKKQTAGTGKRLSLKLENKSIFIIFEDADLDSAVEGIMEKINFQQDGIVSTNSHLLVQESIEERLIAKVKVRIKKLRVGNPLDGSIDISSIISPEKSGWMEATTRKIPKSKTDIIGSDIVPVSFRTQQEAVQMAAYNCSGSTVSLWTENINSAMEVAAQVKARSIWVNGIDTIGLASGFAEVLDYIRPKWTEEFKKTAPLLKITKKVKAVQKQSFPATDYTAKLYIGGKQVCSVEGNANSIYSAYSKQIGKVTAGNGRDIQIAVKAAQSATGWSFMPPHNRALVLYSLAENLLVKAEEFSARISLMTGVNRTKADQEVEQSVERLFNYAGLTDKFERGIQRTTMQEIIVPICEPLGVMGVVCPDEAPLLGFISTAIPPLSTGNRVVAVPSQNYPFSATDFYQILDMTELPDGILNIITGDQLGLAKALAKHNDVDGVWYFGTDEGSRLVEYESTSNLKHTWVNYGLYRDWNNPQHSAGEQFLRESTKVKNIWLPYVE